MATTDTFTEEAQPEHEPPVRGTRSEERAVRRMLRLVLGVLLLAALGLAALLVWLLRPEPAVQPDDQVAGDPMRMVALITGFGQKEPDRLLTPMGVAFDGEGNVWASDTGHGRVLVFTPEGQLVRVVGEDEGDGKLFGPYGVAVDAERDRVYVADWGGRVVQVYTTGGRPVDRYPADDQDLGVFGPDGFSPFGVQVVDGRAVVSSNDGLYRFDSTGHVTARWGGEVRGVDLGMFNFPDAIAVDQGSGRTYVADTMNRRVVALDPDGRWLWVSGQPDEMGEITGFWQLPRGIAVGPDGNLYVVDTFRFDDTGVGTGHVVVLSPEGELVSEFGRAGAGPSEPGFNFPEHIAVGPGGLFAVADRENGRVLVFRVGPLPEPSSKEVTAYRGAVQTPEGVVATPAAG